MLGHRLLKNEDASAPVVQGTLWAWGDNFNGGLGLGDTTNRSSPVQVGTLTNWTSASARTATFGYSTALATRSNGTLWSWGSNPQGELGLGNTTNRSSPVQVGTLTNWKVLDKRNHGAGSFGVSAAIRTDGTLWTWGYNDLGSLGIGTSDPNFEGLANRSSPVQVGSLTDWQQVVGALASAAIKTDGTLWTWGDNSFGQLGLGDTTPRSSPVQVGSLTNWVSISSGDGFMAAIKTDGTLWTWGVNFDGQLGSNNTTNRSSPVQVGSLTNWKEVSCGRNFIIAIKTDGTLWAWGNNSFGQLGLGNTANRSSPVQVGSLTNWKEVSVDSAISAAIKTDGTLWTWGDNILGQLGLGDTTNRSSPVQVGSLTNWVSISSGGGMMLAIRGV